MKGELEFETRSAGLGSEAGAGREQSNIYEEQPCGPAIYSVAGHIASPVLCQNLMVSPV